MRFDNPFDDVFATASHVRVLRALLGAPSDIGRSGRDLARRAGISHPRANQVLAKLAELGLVRIERLPRTDLYRVNRKHVLAEPLSKLYLLEPTLRSELLALVAREIRSRGLPLTEARIFGSAARGDMASGSDVDLALVTSTQNIEAVEAAGQEIAEITRERFGTRLNVLVGSPSLEALAKSRQPKRGVWQAVEREGLDLLAAKEATV